ncbi:MAG: GntR family transcriptional regulator [Lactobacillus sp.]|uniref:GntR family transcriptional regulator n=2 Tax=Lacticaseibacillus suilingensis TaxID=2799577 RepID=A0ABW4BDE3_9LACO|nr:GntR family transcriptional regulator [Lacticaseibacillus suilingensis]MCI1893569.1 GntR family transcriptional regulator [Lactobacillus sp.]MCI1917260.1 GntR family transcriptional regulator [Lactobacillus sp.]MCI1941201.1 GntR family transcriptional regulator [Lactobacillus sp.]MCI2016185.1 GntR family transcriptional regulator [Lactobacillus sp.]MCI2038013.1 GntR family transcriptional regulator [Lactobacillus sp.]
MHIVNVIKKRITDGTYPTGGVIPKQEELAAELGVSRMTVKKALDILTVDGYVLPKRGVGTFVRPKVVRQRNSLPLSSYGGLSNDLGVPVESKVILFDIGFPTAEVQEALEIEENQPVYEIRRLRLVDGQPYGLEHTFLNAAIFPQLKPEVFTGSFYRYLHETCGLTIGGANRSISAEKPDQYNEQYLHSKPDEPILQVKQTVYLDDGQPFEMSIDQHPYSAHHTYTFIDVKR